MSSSRHFGNRKKKSILGKGSTQGLDHIALPAEKECVINVKEQQKK